MKRVIIACEESQAICKAFRSMWEGQIEAFSCDLQECSGGHPEWHFNEDIFKVLAREPKFDLMIAHPPCTHLAVSGARHFKEKKKDGRQKEAIDFFLSLSKVDIEHIAIENPVCIMSSIWRSQDQIIQPYQFGDPFTKTTCLWLKNLPLLIHTKIVDKGEFIEFKSGKRMSKWFAESFGDGKKRSKTFEGIANAMADQWGKYILGIYDKPLQQKLF